ncbi:PBP1A family penicillin-binding protein [Octadecabacter sp. 1_MG-2023]|uniref:penicillin-binding protein 1A n=1 Tax=unclassified Octadecabacter TaxID=196158 RepID=UPI001C0A49DC|nr:MULTISPECIES: PBP1A family penicillin-binding protein [unclassified Octadecabacter]MBU2993501.1 PBP1A family penicillin-binding protein [Octadecabacter sp. B2R22]MDO6733043.1 PBP1A family penicillin-binding protein [Octadecabacter sp. 1_MG-2023]
MVLRFIFSFFGGIFSMLTLGAGMAALTLGAIFYMYGKNLPTHDTLANYQPKTISRVYSGEGLVIDEFAEERRLFTPAAEIPDIVKQAFISAEDKNFYTHDGYDLRGIGAAVVEAIVSRGETLRGASTITQQVAKNFLLDGSRRVERKIQELILAPRIEATLGKEGILELYLNEIDLGVRSFGVTAAARSYFNKTLSELSPAEAAFLAVHPKAPYSYHPVRNREDAIERRDFILEEMYENGYITAQELEVALADPLRTVQNGDFPSYNSERPDRDYFTAAIVSEVETLFPDYEMNSAGLTIRATVDEGLQAAARDALQRQLESYDRGIGRWRGTGVTIPVETLSDETEWRAALRSARVIRTVTLENPWYPAVVLEVGDSEMRMGIEGWEEGDEAPIIPRRDIEWMRGSFADNFTPGDVVHVRRMMTGDNGTGDFIRWTLRQVPEVQGAFMAMDVNTGRVLAMQGGFGYEIAISELNRAYAERQPGSAFKPFVFAAALDSGYTPATIVVDAPIEVVAGGEVWRPMNASDRFYGPTPLRTGIEQSRNVMTVRLAQEVGMRTVAEYAERFGVYDRMNAYLSAALGSEETTLYKLVAAYAMFANGGERVEPTLVDRVQDRSGATIYRHDQRVCAECLDPNLEQGRSPRIASDRERVMDPVTAYQLTSMMQGVVQRGTARSAVNLPVPIAGKTGTTNDAKDVWFVGFSSNIVAGCYIGFDTPRSLGRGASGGGLCGPVFNSFMRTAIQRYGGREFSAPDACIFIKIDRFTGARLPDSASGDNVVRECFREEPVFGITFDGGFAMAADLPLFDEVRPPAAVSVTTSSGETATINSNASFGSLSSGGLY